MSAIRIIGALAAFAILATAADRASYSSPYQVKFHFSEEDLVGDLLTGPRGDGKDSATVPYRDWYDDDYQTRWNYRGPSTKHYPPPDGLGTRSVQWVRERLIATGMRFIGYSYQHHHVPDWEPPADWPTRPDQTTPVGKGLDCSNFSAFVYNQALGIRPTGDVRAQAELKEMPGPGEGKSIPVRHIELPKAFEDFPKVLQTGDLLYINNTRGEISHVVLWVGNIGQSPDGVPLILDSTGTGALDCNCVAIPDGIYLRPFRPTNWYFTQASHVLRIVPDDT